MKRYFAVTIDSDDIWSDLKIGHLIERGKKYSDDLVVSEIAEEDLVGAHWPMQSSYHVGPLRKRE